MNGYKSRVFRLLLYKNYLVRKRHWKVALFVEIIIPILLFVSIWGARNLVARPARNVNGSTTSSVRSKEDLLAYQENQLYIVPDNEFTKFLTDELQKCLQIDPDLITRFKTDGDMLKAHKNFKLEHSYENIMVINFQDKNIDFNTTHLEYKIQMDESLPKTIYNGLLSVIEGKDGFSQGISGLQLCLDESFIKIKGKDVNIEFYTQQMPVPSHVEPDIGDVVLRRIFCVFALMAFVIPLCIETSNASNEKFLGINVLMAMNGVPNYLNLLSWLVSGIIFSLFYIIPIVILVNFSSTDNALPFLYYGNSFIFWLILILHIAHLISFGMHFSAYFTRSLFMVTGILVVYVGSTAMQEYGIKEKNYPIVPYLGILFPNILLYRACQEINYYESILTGIQWNNMFRVGDAVYGSAGSIGMILIFSLFGIIFHFIMANYIYAVNPGKYGVKKNPFYFLKILKRVKKAHDYNEVENFESNNASGQLFESVSEGVFTPGIQIRNLKKTYSANLFSKTKVHALRGVSVDFFQGQITALLGHNGAGKTTMMSILTGMISPSEGLVLINGKNVKDKLDEIMNDMGLCPQENMLFPHLSVAEQLRFFAMLKNKNKSRSVVESEVSSFLKKLKLFDKRNALPKELSGGQKRRVCLGMAMIGDSSTLILDEPTSGLDPESRRDIWNILLKMRGEKTILISTHDMEEADILGDRIAIVHSGSLRSFGTSMFLKKLLGQGNIEVILSTEPWCNPEKIRIHMDPQSEILNTDAGKIQLSIPYTPELPDSLDKIENNKKELGVTGMSVSLITLEQVFLKVTQDDDATRAREAFIDTTEKLKGRELFMHSAMALLRKKMTYTIKNITTIFTILALLILPLICTSFILMDHTESNEMSDPMQIRLDMYYNPKTYYRTDSNSATFGDNYKAIANKFHGKAIKDSSENRKFVDVLLDVGTKDIGDYNYRLLAAATFDRSPDAVRANALYNNVKATFALPISINLLTNTLIKTMVGSEYEITMSAQELPRERDSDDMAKQLVLTYIERYIVPIVLILFLYPAVALFVIHPMRESIAGVKHLQRMAGVSCFNYWGTMFLFDFIVLFTMSLLVVIGFIIMDAVLGLWIFKGLEVFIFTLLFVLFAINILPLIYAFSFWKRSSSAAIKLLSLLPLGLVAVELIMHGITYGLDGNSNAMNISRPIQKAIFLCTPHISFLHGQISFFKTAKANANCKRMSTFLSRNTLCNFYACCDMECTNGTCEKPLTYFNNFEDDIALETSLISLCLTPILYFGILCMLEYKLIPKLIARIHGGKPNDIDQTFEEQVKKVKHSLAFEISKIKSKLEGADDKKAANKKVVNVENGFEETLTESIEFKNHVFLVYELRKLYGKLVAVQDLSFGVNQSECFGLLGVNGAGKSTTFKMMTGEEIPNNGMMYLNNRDLLKNREKYLSQMGYCPQNDAIIRSLNSYDHLRLFARIRGIPESEVNIEVKKWIDRLNLKVCASQPSGTYSGGNKRRLNIAIALIGIPNLVLLDEPTTGVDPAARRSLWNVIQSCQTTGQAVILTSHSMEECEALCNRLAIMVDGKLECIGPSQELKQRFGAGYDIQLKLNPEKSKDEVHQIKKDITGALNCEVIDENSGYLSYHLTSTDITWRQMYDVIRELKSRYTCIEDFSILSSTLEQLFLLFARAADRSNCKRN